MAEGVAAERNAPGAQIPPPGVRQRKLNRAATFSDGVHPMQPPMSRRRSSIFSDYSDTRPALLRPGNDMEALTSSEEPSFWHSAPLAFAILPALGGLLFKNGGSVVTDVSLLVLGSLFLNWCVRAPWEWYHAAQQVQYVGVDYGQSGGTIPEEDEESERAPEKDIAALPEPVSDAPTKESTVEVPAPTKSQTDAARQLAKEEIFALAACFLGPLLGAYILHAIRSQLTRPAEGLVSNYNLTIFIMAAELRPVSHLIKMKQARMVHLQRLARPDGNDRVGSTDAQELSRRLADVEAHLAGQPVTSSDAETTKLSATIRQNLQPQLDALNRAVRRYEKRQVAQSIQIEARFGELETRLQDALSLAAAAARTGQRPGVGSIMLTWIINTVAYGVQTCWAAVTYPYRLAAYVAYEVRCWFVKTDRQPRNRNKGPSYGHSSVPPTRVLSGNRK